ncbi:MAG: response regulator [Bacteroidales bacterium]|nr:response regulator [Bacteroidales bacterium]
MMQVIQANTLFKTLIFPEATALNKSTFDVLPDPLATHVGSADFRDRLESADPGEVISTSPFTLGNLRYKASIKKLSDADISITLMQTDRPGAHQEVFGMGLEHFREIYQNTMVGLLRTDISGNIVVANQAVLNLLGYDTFNEFEKHKIDEHRVLINYNSNELFEAVNERGFLYGVESSWQTRDGNAIYVLENIRLIKNGSEESTKYEITLENISSRKIAENQLRQLNSIFTDLGVDTKQNIQTIVKKTNLILNGACALYNRLDDKAESLILWSEYNAPEDIDKTDHPEGHICYEATIKGHDKTIAISDLNETSFFESDPSVKKYKLRSYLGHPVKVYGQVIGSLCIVDVKSREFTETEKKIISTLAVALSLEHERHILEQKLEDSKIAAETASMAKTRFLANMSHEIRTPLNGIMGFSEILGSQEPDERKRRMLKMIEESGNQLLQIVNDIFDYSMIEARKLTMQKSAFDLKSLLGDTLAFFIKDAEIKGLQIALDTDKVSQSYLVGDHFKFNQVVFNLLSNAVKFTDQGTVLVIAATHQTDEDVYVEITIEDTGIGIDQEKLVTIFEEFEQLEYYLTKKTRGTGLGLAITKKLVLFLNGEISVESESGKGSRFRISIPFQANTIKKSNEIMNDQIDKQHEEPTKINILLAEDNEANQFLIKAITKSENWDITVVDDGEQAVHAYKNGNFDLILMDVQMPVMNGYEATQIIRDIEKEKGIHTPIIALTAYAMKSDRDECISAGMDDYIAKPFKKQQFLETINAIINNAG